MIAPPLVQCIAPSTIQGMRFVADLPIRTNMHYQSQRWINLKPNIARALDVT
jgi:hypothetical protein